MIFIGISQFCLAKQFFGFVSPVLGIINGHGAYHLNEFSFYTVMVMYDSESMIYIWVWFVVFVSIRLQGRYAKFSQDTQHCRHCNTFRGMFLGTQAFADTKRDG